MNTTFIPRTSFSTPLDRCCTLMLCAFFFADLAQAQGDIIWSTEVTTTTVTTTSPSDYNFTQDGVDVTISYAFSSPAPATYLSSYFETRTDELGAETTYLGLQQDAAVDDTGEWLRATFTFSPGITGLSLTFLDVDLADGSWRDILVVTASNGGNVAPTTTSLGGGDVEGPTSNGDCSGRNSSTTPCFRGIGGNVAETSSTSNVTLDYSATITQVIVDYFAGDAPSTTTPAGQRIGLGDITWSGTLPVELTAFTAQADGRAVNLNWETASETNNAGFEIQHLSKEDEVSPEWEVLGFVEGHGTTLQEQHYGYRVGHLTPGSHRFRLKQIDYDGTFEYSPEVEVAIEMMEQFVIEPAYPNPFNPDATFRFAVRASQHVEVVLYDVLGRPVRSLYAGTATAGQMETVDIDGSGLPSGLYLVRVQGKAFIETQTVTLAK